MSKGFASSYRIILLAVGIVACFGGVGVRLVYLHVIDRDELVRSIERARWQIIPETARRGDILDDRGNILATSRSMIILGVDPQVLRKEDEAKWPELAQLIGMPLGELSRIFTTKTRPSDASANPSRGPATPKFTIYNPAGDRATKDATDSPDETETQLEDRVDERGERAIRWAKLSETVTESTYQKIRELNIKGVYGQRVYRRAYPHRSLAAHVVGYVNKEGVPAAGIEAYADFYLRGRDGWREGERDGKGREVAQFRTREVPAADGYSVVLSIDAAIQYMVEQELAYIAEKFRPQKATIIVSDPRTGFILALGNYPSFDLNEYNKVARNQLHVMRNVAVTDQYEPGSTFKIVAAAGALNDGLVSPQTRFDCNTAVMPDDLGTPRKLPGEDHAFHEPLSVGQIISLSSNRGAAQLAFLLGRQRFYDYARSFGFGQRTGFPVGGEVPGMMASPSSRDWDGLTITRMPMGHAVAATPLQMHMAMSVIASGGFLMRPQIIKEIRDANGETVYRYGPISKQRVISEGTARTMAQLLQGVTIEGTGRSAAIPNYEVAGKTGTTQKIVDGRYSNKHHVASFVGFFPASRPEIAISVIVDEADVRTAGGTAYGSTVAAPSFKRLGEQLIPYRKIEPVYSAVRGSSLVMGGSHR